MKKLLFALLIFVLPCFAIDYSDIAPTCGFSVVDARSVAIGYINGDNLNDIYFSARNSAPSKIYLNAGDYTFSTSPSWSANPGNYTCGVGLGDYDNDGDQDVVIVSLGGDIHLYRNEGIGLVEITGIAGLSSVDNNIAAFFLDYNDDGLLDIFQLKITSSKLYRNNDDGTFTDISVSSGISVVVNANGVACGDYDNDGDIDIFISSTSGPNYLMVDCGEYYLNYGAIAGLSSPDYALGADFGDIDNDLYLDLAVSGDDRLYLYRNNGDGTFEEVAISVGIDSVNSLHETPIFVDGDGDGDLDLYDITYGDCHFYKNSGGMFIEDTPIDMRFSGSVSGGAIGDVTSDHVPEIVACGWDGQPHGLFSRTRPVDHKWLAVRLTGTISNRDAIGARITVISEGVKYIREIGCPMGRCSNRPALEAYFEFPRNILAVDTLIIHWPLGAEDTIYPISTDTLICLVEDSTASINESDNGPDFFRISSYPNPFNSSVSISLSFIPGLTRPYGSSENPEIEVYDINGHMVERIPPAPLNKWGAECNEASGLFVWQPDDNLGSGVYLVRAKSGYESVTKRIVYLK